MLKLGQKPEPKRIVLKAAEGKEPEAYVVMAPITAAMRRRAQGVVRRLVAGVDDIEDIDADTLGDAGEAASRELIRLGMIEWGGIGDANGKPLELTPDRDTRMKTANAPERPEGTVDLLLADEEIFAKLDADYVRPDAVRIAEKNGLSASPTGTGEAATRGKGTASSHAAARKRGAASRKAAAKTAPTPKRRSRPKPAKASGRS